MVSERQVVDFAFISSLLTSLRVTSLKDVILGRSFVKVLGTLTQSSALNELHMVSILSQKKDAKPSASDASQPGGIGFPPGSLVRESKPRNNFHWSPLASSIATFKYRYFALFNFCRYTFLACWYVFCLVQCGT